MGRKNRKLLQEVFEIERIEDLLMEYVEQPDSRVCPVCKRPAAEWEEDWLPEEFEACGRCWDDYREAEYKALGITEEELSA